MTSEQWDGFCRGFRDGLVKASRWAVPIVAAVAGAIMESGELLAGLSLLAVCMLNQSGTIDTLNVLHTLHNEAYRRITGEEP